VRLEIPPGHVGLVWPRSGLAVRHGIDTLAGVIDSDYRGELKVVLVNHGDEPFRIAPGRPRGAAADPAGRARALHRHRAGGGHGARQRRLRLDRALARTTVPDRDAAMPQFKT
jgi:hypothetical protein